MLSLLAYPVMILAAVLAVWTGVSAGRYRPTGEIQMVIAIVLEAGLIAQTVIALTELSGAGLDEPVTFVAYSIGILLPVPLGFQLARLERTRWGSVVLCFMTVVAGIMTLRLAGLWGMFGG